MIALVALLLAAPFPSSNKTSWMQPAAFHLAIGMPRAEAVKALESNGWKLKRGDDDEHYVVDYADDKSLTLHFSRDRLHSVRFELYAIVGRTRDAFAEEKSFLRGTLGKPRVASKALLVYDNRLPNVVVVLNDDPKSASGQKGVGVLVVRYYDPAPAR
ncbi:MAG TPA: hypothetical protein VG323_20010 [Thermoanaerobaculia bacterium]|nr:hypothetical protein [Thermoanaerobaculia bacterium]